MALPRQAPIESDIAGDMLDGFIPETMAAASKLPLFADLILGAGALLLALLLAILVLLALSLGRRNEAQHHRAEADQAIAVQLAAASNGLEAQLAELKGRLTAMTEMGAARQSEFSSALDQRLDHVTTELSRALAETRQEMSRNLTASSERTSDHLSRLAERMAVIDTAQANLTELSSRVVSLQDVLSNKQSRGAFGQVRMESIIQDGLPPSAYTFQATLSNGKRPDCLIQLPNAPADLVVDAKFPLEGFEALRQARNAEDEQAAARQIRTAIGRHIDDIAGKYLLPGETQDTALMFVPSEAAYAELHERFPDVIQKAHRARVFIVSPNMLMLAIQTMQAILKDVKMREAAGLIQREVANILGDVVRLAERVGDLERHFGLASKTLEKIATSADKITNRGRKIEALELEDAQLDAEPPSAKLAAGGREA